MNNKILLLNPPAPHLFIRDYYCSFESKADYYWPPQDLLILSGLLSKEFDIYVIDGIFEKISLEKIVEFIENKKIETLIFTTGTATLKFDKEFIEKIKEKTGVYTIASAGILKYTPELFFKKLNFLDAIFTDFTEREIIEFLKNRKSEKQWNTIYYKKDKQIISPIKKYNRIFSYPPPLLELFPYKKYKIPIAKKHPFAVVITSLGCPYKCRFCTIANYGVKYREIENVIEEFEKLKKMNIKEILFQDPTFTVNSKYLTSLLNKMIEKKYNFSFSCNSDINSMNEEKIKLLKQAGCHTVNIGLESGDDNILKLYNKQLNTKKAVEIVNLFKKYKIRTLGYFIIGLPGETGETIKKTIDFALSLDVDYASFAIATPDVGSDLRKEAIEKGWIEEDIDFFDSTENPVLNIPDLPKEEIIALRNLAERKFYFRLKYILKKLKNPSEFLENFKNGIALFKRIFFEKNE
jgi:radical SAM superfamily enzyme YgiQ (UPF0313 family)